MNPNIQIFNNPQFGEVRIIVNESGEPLFAASDVCSILGYSNPSKVISDHTEADERYSESLERGGSMLFINESGLYSLVIRSNKSEAKPFRKWVTSEVLPSIRKHGAYMTNDALEKALTSPDFLIQLATNLKEEQQKRIAAEQERERLQVQVESAQPAIIYTNAVSGSTSSCLIGELAKILRQNGVNVGQNRLFQWLRDHGYLGRYGERRNVPNQQYIEQGLFELKQGVRSGNNGVMHTTVTPKVTGKGQVYFINKFLNDGVGR
jgi:anti-repressor protein